MKNSHSTRFFLGLILGIISLSLCLSACSKDDDMPSSKSHKVVFKAMVSEGSSISDAVYGIDEQLSSVTSLEGTTWSSEEVTANAGAINANVSITATGVDANSTLTVQIYVDGALKKEGKSKGKTLVGMASYRF